MVLQLVILVTVTAHNATFLLADLNTGSMSEFTWNKGGNYDKQWAEHLISDASVCVNCFHFSQN